MEEKISELRQLKQQRAELDEKINDRLRRAFLQSSRRNNGA
jgi:hypothetical protein